ncbi:unnamed protein product [Adineta ricciae]|uniref:Uncharacterized protein n=1 Tax=Adineta ricciae TaxID=249248 RepID=A0A814ZCD9_ADIRI|nr:unnamed protein product [Adineta ricciae]
MSSAVQINNTHQLESTIDDNQFVQIVIEFPGKYLDNGKSITIGKSNSNDEKTILGNYKDLYNDSLETKDVHIEIPIEFLQRGMTISIEKENIFIKKTLDYHKEQSHNLSNNQFTKRDHLQTQNLMEITIEIAPEMFHNGQTITIRKENLETIIANFPYRRQSKVDINN